MQRKPAAGRYQPRSGIGAGRPSQRDRGFDGKFVYAVKTTGVYCRPSCPARLPKPQNVAFYTGARTRSRRVSALAGGAGRKRRRPRSSSRRHRRGGPQDRTGRTSAGTGRTCRAAGMSPYYFHRLFKSVTGVTPKAYAAAHRAQRMRRGTRQEQARVTEAIYNAGFNSSSRFYATTNQVLGMTPSAFRAAAPTRNRFAVGECSLGPILVARSEKGVCAIFLGDDPRRAGARPRRTGSRRPTSSAATPNSRNWSPRWSGSSRRRRSASTCRSTCAARPSSSASGRRSARSRPARRRAMPRSRDGSARPRRCGPSHKPAPQTGSRSRFPATGWFTATAMLAGYRWGVERKRDLLAKESAA